MSLLRGSFCAEVDRSRIITNFCCSIRPMFSVTYGLSCFLYFLLLNQTYVLSNVRPELFIVCSCLCFSLCVIFIFYNRHSYFYLLYLISGRIFHLGGLISRMHTSDYISFAEWECFCFSSFTEYNFGFMNIQCMAECEWFGFCR